MSKTNSAIGSCNRGKRTARNSAFISPGKIEKKRKERKKTVYSIVEICEQILLIEGAIFVYGIALSEGENK